MKEDIFMKVDDSQNQLMKNFDERIGSMEDKLNQVLDLL